MDTIAVTSNRLNAENKRTLEQYYARVNQGDFMGALETLSDDVVFTIPGDPAILPFAGRWVGRKGLSELFQAFGNAFWVVHMEETRIITTEDQLISFNDEAFKVKSTGRYYRVGVVHHVTFNEQAKINTLINLHDTYPAVQAFSGQAAIAQPIPVPTLLPHEAEIPDRVAQDIVERFYRLRVGGVDDVEDFLDDQVSLLAPGNPDLLPFSGAWIGKEEVMTVFRIHRAALTNQEITLEKVIANHGSVAIRLTERGNLADTGRAVELMRYELVQLTDDNKIGKVSIYVDTYPLTTAP